MFSFIEHVLIISELGVTLSELITDATSLLQNSHQKRLRSQNSKRNFRPGNEEWQYRDYTFDLGLDM